MNEIHSNVQFIGFGLAAVLFSEFLSFTVSYKFARDNQNIDLTNLTNTVQKNSFSF